MPTTGETKPKKRVIRGSKLVKKLEEQVKKLEGKLKDQKRRTRIGHKKRTHRPSYWSQEVGRHARQYIKDGSDPKTALKEAVKVLSDRKRQRPLGLRTGFLREEPDIGAPQRGEGQVGSPYKPIRSALPSRAEGQHRKGYTPKVKTPLSLHNYREEGEPSPYNSPTPRRIIGARAYVARTPPRARNSPIKIIKGKIDPPNLEDHNGDWRSALNEIEESWRESGYDDEEVISNFRREGWIR